MMNQDYGNQEAPSKGRRQKTTQERQQEIMKEYGVDLKDLEAILATHKDELGGEG